MHAGTLIVSPFFCGFGRTHAALFFATNVPKPTSVILSSAISVTFKGIHENTVLWMAVKLLILPLIAGISYEFIKYAGKHDNLLVKILAAPGLWMQRLTTKEPDDAMIEVALEAFKAVLPDETEEIKDESI